VRAGDWSEQELLRDLIDIGHVRRYLFTNKFGSAWVRVNVCANIFRPKDELVVLTYGIWMETKNAQYLHFQLRCNGVGYARRGNDQKILATNFTSSQRARPTNISCFPHH